MTIHSMFVFYFLFVDHVALLTGMAAVPLVFHI